jgi:hypothetical protein
MKFLYSTVILIFFSITIHGQAATLTYDAVNNVNQVKAHLTQLENLSETFQQSAMLQKTLEYYELAQKALSKVNSVLHDVWYVESIIKRQIYIVESYSTYLNKARGFKHVSSNDLLRFTTSLNELLDNAERIIDLSTKFLKNDYFEMRDNERLTALENTEKKMSTVQTTLDIEMNTLEMKERDGALKESLKQF